MALAREWHHFGRGRSRHFTSFNDFCVRFFNCMRSYCYKATRTCTDGARNEKGRSEAQSDQFAGCDPAGRCRVRHGRVWMFVLGPIPLTFNYHISFGQRCDRCILDCCVVWSTQRGLRILCRDNASGRTRQNHVVAIASRIHAGQILFAAVAHSPRTNVRMTGPIKACLGRWPHVRLQENSGPGSSRVIQLSQ